MDTNLSHACRMPRRRGKWHHRIYICNCKSAWTAVYHPSQSSMAEYSTGGFYIWYPVNGVTVSKDAVYLHG